MKRSNISLAVVLILLALSGTAISQPSRDVGAQRFWLDDNAGNKVLLQFLGPTPGIVTFPSGNSSTLANGLAPSQTLRWNGTGWVSASNLLNDGTSLTLSGGLISTVSTGTAPFIVASTTKVANLNADMIDGLHTYDFASAGTSVIADAPITGGGPLSADVHIGLSYGATLSAPGGILGLNLSNPNGWLATQSLQATPAQGDNLISSVNAGTSTINAIRLNPSVLLQSEIIGTANEIDVNLGVSDVTLSLPATINANVIGSVTGNVTGNLSGNVTGNLSGNVTGNLTGNVTGNVTGNLTGNVTGNVIGNLTGDVTGNVSGTAANVTGIVLEANGGTAQSTYTTGDLLYASAANTLSRLGIGSANQVLTVSGGLPTWGSVPVSGPAVYAVSSVVDVNSDPFAIPGATINTATVVFLDNTTGGEAVITLSAGNAMGQVLILMTTSNGHIHLDDSGLAQIKDPQFHFHSAGDNITLVWNGTQWVETCHTNV